ncbi:MAG: D-alanyl-D-alanine carboxypeptidase [Ruminococcaceae bacterium]|nr:D-alanyl-D-alanine carboxypeptidase [Oscillospiraceae bacterium]
MRRIVPLLFACVLFFSLGCPALAGSYENEPPIRSDIAVLYESNSGTLIFSKNGTKRAYPASTTKIMTALLAIENCQMDEPVTATRSALNTVTPGSSIAGLQNGEVLSMYEMLECLLVASGNDAAAVIAAHVGGSVDRFVEMMNERSEELGCQDTNYMNPSGLHHEEHYTTAEDLLLVAEEAMKHPVFREIVAMRQVAIEPTNKVSKTRYFNNTNQLISSASTSVNLYSKAIGIKTGHTTPAGYCLVSAAADKDREYIAVVLAGYIDEKNYRNYSYVDSINLFLWGFSDFAQRTVVSSSDLVTELPVELAKGKDFVILRAAQDVTAYLHKTDEIDDIFRKVVTVQENIAAPVRAGDILGALTVMKGNEVYARVDLVAMNDVERSEGLYYFEAMGNFFAHPGVRAGIALLASALIVYLVFWVLYNKRRRAIRARKRRRGIDDEF